MRHGTLFFSPDPAALSRRLLGLPKSQSSLLSKLTETSLLFLFNVRTRLMLGVFAPDGPAGMELEPDAFGGGSRFPVQVRFTSVHEGGHVLQVPEASLGDVLRYRNASARFDLLLRGRAVDEEDDALALRYHAATAGASEAPWQVAHRGCTTMARM